MTSPAIDLGTVPVLAQLLAREASAGASLPTDVCVEPRLLEHALFAPLREAALRPGKEFRGRLVGIAWQMCGGQGEVPVELSGCVEALHLGSLIVDDIEDGSLSRRGAPALHRTVGLPIALNAGNWLYFFPGVLLSRMSLEPSLELSLRAALERGVIHCHYGQALDLSVRVTELRQREVADIVSAATRLKTGSLMELAAELGALAGGGSTAHVQALSRLGCRLGIALQMLDDLTGITSTSRCHKGHEDLCEARPSWVWAWLSECEDDVGYQRLKTLAEQVVRRDVHPEVVAAQLRERIAGPGRRAIRNTLRTALADVQATFAPSSGLDELRLEVERLERYND